MNSIGLETFGMTKQKLSLFVSNFQSGHCWPQSEELHWCYSIVKVQHFLRILLMNIHSSASRVDPSSEWNPALLLRHQVPRARCHSCQAFSRAAVFSIRLAKFTLSSSISAIKFSAGTNGHLATLAEGFSGFIVGRVFLHGAAENEWKKRCINDTERQRLYSERWSANPTFVTHRLFDFTVW